MSAGFASASLACDGVARLGDATLRYIEAAELCFEDLRQVAGQLAGLLLLSASGAHSAGPLHPMVAVAEGLLETARDTTPRLKPHSARAKHHHRHLLSAAGQLAETLDRLRSLPTGRASLDEPMRSLTSAWEELGAASRALPGFDLVDFSQACCAQHAPAARLSL